MVSRELSVALKTFISTGDEVGCAFNIMLAEHKVDLSKYDYVVNYTFEEFNLADYPCFYDTSYVNIEVRHHDSLLTFDPDAIFTAVSVGDTMYKVKTDSLIKFLNKETRGK